MRAPVIAASLMGPDLGAVDGAARAVGGEDGGMPGFDDLLEAEQTFARAAGAGAAHRFESEDLESPGDQLAVETPADDDGCAGAAKVEGARQDALMPEAEDFGSRADAEGKRHSAGFSDGLEAPGAAITESSPRTSRGTTASTMRCRRVNLGLAGGVTG